MVAHICVERGICGEIYRYAYIYLYIHTYDKDRLYRHTSECVRGEQNTPMKLFFDGLAYRPRTFLLLRFTLERTSPQLSLISPSCHCRHDIVHKLLLLLQSLVSLAGSEETPSTRLVCFPRFFLSFFAFFFLLRCFSSSVLPCMISCILIKASAVSLKVLTYVSLLLFLSPFCLSSILLISLSLCISLLIFLLPTERSVEVLSSSLSCLSVAYLLSSLKASSSLSLVCLLSHERKAG